MAAHLEGSEVKRKRIMKARAKEITGSYTVEGWRCKQCDIFYAKKDLSDGLCWYCISRPSINKRNDLSR